MQKHNYWWCPRKIGMCRYTSRRSTGLRNSCGCRDSAMECRGSMRKHFWVTISFKKLRSRMALHFPFFLGIVNRMEYSPWPFSDSDTNSIALTWRSCWMTSRVSSRYSSFCLQQPSLNSYWTHSTDEAIGSHVIEKMGRPVLLWQEPCQCYGRSGKTNLTALHSGGLTWE